MQQVQERKGGGNLRLEQLEPRLLCVVGLVGNGLPSTDLFPGVGRITNPLFPQAWCSGTLLPSGRHVLTAAHCLFDDFIPGVNQTWQVRFPEIPTPYDFTIAAPNPNPSPDNDVFIHPNFLGFSRDGYDIAIVDLDQTVLVPPNNIPLTTYDIYRGADEFSVSTQGPDPTTGIIAIVGYGENDSGGPNFIDGKIAGVTSTGIHDSPDIAVDTDACLTIRSSVGEFYIATRVSKYQSWIDSFFPPKVMGVTVRAELPGSQILHEDYLVPSGFDSASGMASQLATVPIAKANQIAIRFSKPVQFAQSDVSLNGINGVDYEASSPGYDPAAEASPPDPAVPEGDFVPAQVLFARKRDLGESSVGEYSSVHSYTWTKVYITPLDRKDPTRQNSGGLKKVAASYHGPLGKDSHVLLCCAAVDPATCRRE